ncbi:hypothetical protein LXA43DRAFT_1133290 [Ganoderma leucocontextum]|nr:hypothetical protein LXA43DRAFT_1133290 [Ganoderma leucocontextum]
MPPETDATPRFEALGQFSIQYDVLKMLCMAAKKRFRAKYLWLDKLCVRQDSPMEMSRWRMPSNVKRAFGFAKGTLVLLNGLCRMPPLLPPGGTYPVLARSSDFAVSLRAFLELAFNKSLQDIAVLLAFDPGHNEVLRRHQFNREQGHPSADADRRVPDLQAITISFKTFLENSVQVGGDSNAQPMISRITSELDSELLAQIRLDRDDPNMFVNDDTESRHRSRVKTLLALLSCRDQLLRQNSMRDGDVPSDPTRMGDWEVAIWYNVLYARTADSCGQFIFGLAWLLQDLHDVGRPAPPDLVSSVMARARERLDDVTGEADLRIPWVHAVLPFLVYKFNEIRGPSLKVVEKLERDCRWKVPFSPQWASVPVKHEKSPDWDIWTHIKPLDDSPEPGLPFGYLFLTVRPIGGRKLLVLGLEGAIHPNPEHLSFPPSQSTARMEDSGADAIPAKIWRLTEEAEEVFVQYFKVKQCPYLNWAGCSQVFKYHADTRKNAAEWKSWAEQWPKRCYWLTPIT